MCLSKTILTLSDLKEKPCVPVSTFMLWDITHINDDYDDVADGKGNTLDLAYIATNQERSVATLST